MTAAIRKSPKVAPREFGTKGMKELVKSQQQPPPHKNVRRSVRPRKTKPKK